MRKNYYRLAMAGFTAVCMVKAFGAQSVDLKNQTIPFLQSIQSEQMSLKQVSSDIDFNQTTHIRFRELYAGYPIWGSDAILHVPHGGKLTLEHLRTVKAVGATMNGHVYQDLQADLNYGSNTVFNSSQHDRAIQEAIHHYQASPHRGITNAKADLMVYVGQNNKARWAYLVHFFVRAEKGMPAQPTYIMDAETFTPYKEWNDLKTLDDVLGGGYGGNEKMGKQIYDGLNTDLPAINIQRDAKNKICYLANTDVVVKDANVNDATAQFTCKVRNGRHNHVFWDGDADAVNGAYSPQNDALFVGKVVKDLYQQWYGIPVLVSDGQPMLLTMRVHAKDEDGKPLENAYWDGKQMTFGDGENEFYPFVSLGVGAHEISHGFTEQHSNLAYYEQSGGLNESFSDMASQAAEFYALGHNSWQIGAEIMKANGKALRYMDEPTKDCYGEHPGDECSISHIRDYSDGLNVHYSSGIFNKVFFMMGTTPQWDAKKAFDVMVQANRNYWTATTTFAEAACGVLKATQDYHYDVSPVIQAFAEVGIDISQC